jgi:hypothetical protein
MSDLDPYAYCPCGSGKKLKFCCCSDIQPELAKLLRLLESEQSLGLIELAREITAKHGQRAAILTLQSIALLGLGETEEAERITGLLRTLQPENVTLLTLELQLAMSHADVATVLDKISAVMSNAEKSIPVTFLQALTEAAILLARVGHVPTAVYLLGFMLRVLPAEEQGFPHAILQRLITDQSLPVLWRDIYKFREINDDAPGSQQLVKANLAFLQAQVRQSRQILLDLIAKHGESPDWVYDVGVTYLVDAQESEAVKWFLKYAEDPRVPAGDAADALLLAIAFGMPDEQFPMTPLVRVTWNLSAFEPVSERLLSDRHIFLILSQELLRQIGVVRNGEDAPPPRLAGRLLDRDKDAWQPGMSVEELPTDLGDVLLYGRETDQPARLVAYFYADEYESPALERLRALVGDELVGEPVREEIETTATHLQEVRSRKFLGQLEEGVDFTRLRIEVQKAPYLSKWCRTPHPWLEGKSPAEAVSDERLRKRVLALLTSLELDLPDEVSADLTPALRQQLGLPSHEFDAEPVSLTNATIFPKLHRIDVSKLSDEGLRDAMLLAANRGTIASQRRLAWEVVRRVEQNTSIDPLMAYSVLANVAATVPEQVEWWNKVIAEAERRGKSPAQALLSLLTVFLRGQDYEGFSATFKRLAERHLNEPGVRESLQRITQALGLDRAAAASQRGLPREAQIPGFAPARSPAPTEAPAGKLWTPDGSTASEAESKPASKLWLPE